MDIVEHAVCCSFEFAIGIDAVLDKHLAGGFAPDQTAFADLFLAGGCRSIAPKLIGQLLKSFPALGSTDETDKPLRFWAQHACSLAEQLIDFLKCGQ